MNVYWLLIPTLSLFITYPYIDYIGLVISIPWCAFTHILTCFISSLPCSFPISTDIVLHFEISKAMYRYFVFQLPRAVPYIPCVLDCAFTKTAIPSLVSRRPRFYSNCVHYYMLAREAKMRILELFSLPLRFRLYKFMPHDRSTRDNYNT